MPQSVARPIDGNAALNDADRAATGAARAAKLADRVAGQGLVGVQVLAQGMRRGASGSGVRAAMVETGEADIAPLINQIDATNEATDFAYPNSETVYLRLDTSIPPLDDERVRRALNLAAYTQYSKSLNIYNKNKVGRSN